MNEQKPSVGRVVHYQSYGTPNGEYTPQPRAAIITELYAPGDFKAENLVVEGDGTQSTVGLCVLNPTGQFFNRFVPYAESPTPGHWNWPPRV
jgi:hypothetical protein